MRPESKQMPPNSDLPWVVAHTRPRCEKKLAKFCELEEITVSLPVYQRIHRYRGKTVTFEKPFFPGYVFLRPSSHQYNLISRSDYVANLLHVPDQDQFHHQLADIFSALETNYDVFLVPEIRKGTRVRIRTGPLRGLEGYVEERQGLTTVLLRLDFIQQAAGVKIDAAELELT